MNEFKSFTQLARELRKNQTRHEAFLWKVLRNRKLKGFKFLRQYPIVYGNDNHGKSLFFIVDFYCAEKKLVLELDGNQHNFQKDYDKSRTEVLEEMGLHVLRIKNEELKNIEDVTQNISDILLGDLP